MSEGPQGNLRRPFVVVSPRPVLTCYWGLAYLGAQAPLVQEHLRGVPAVHLIREGWGIYHQETD